MSVTFEVVFGNTHRTENFVCDLLVCLRVSKSAGDLQGEIFFKEL